MTEIANSVGMAREDLYKAFDPERVLRFNTVSRVCAALDVRLVVQSGMPLVGHQSKFKAGLVRT
jgi:DNA-binding phage protein